MEVRVRMRVDRATEMREMRLGMGVGVRMREDRGRRG